MRCLESSPYLLPSYPKRTVILYILNLITLDFLLRLHLIKTTSKVHRNAKNVCQMLSVRNYVLKSLPIFIFLLELKIQILLG